MSRYYLKLIKWIWSPSSRLQKLVSWQEILKLHSLEHSWKLEHQSQVPTRQEILKILAGQAAISLENALLYTERKRAEEELRGTNEELESFVFAVSHDLKSPLVSLQGFVGALIEENKDRLTPRNKHITERIVANVDKMEELISDLLEFSRVGRISGPAVRINVRDMLEGLSRSYAIRLKEKEIKLKITAKEDCLIHADREQMIKVLDNLMSNAVKSMGDTKAPKIGLLCDCGNESRVRICVKDNGIGIDPKYHEKVFEIFQRLDAGPKTEGTGVGLALVKKILEDLGGKIWVESELGKGAEFWIDLPISH